MGRRHGDAKIEAGGRTETPRNRLPSRAFPPLGPGYHHVDVASVAPGADGPLTLRGNGAISAVFAGHLGIAELYPVAHAHDEPHPSCVAPRHPTCLNKTTGEGARLSPDRRDPHWSDFESMAVSVLDPWE